jgi:hypothetical protein
MTVPVQERLLYASPNGDRWSLARDSETGRVFVRHRPNLPSGGQTSDTDLGAFLVQGSLGPEKQELLRLIGTMVEDTEGDDSDPRASHWTDQQSSTASE